MAEIVRFPARTAEARQAAQSAPDAVETQGRGKAVALSLPMLLRMLPPDLHPDAVAGAMVAAHMDAWEKSAPDGDREARKKAAHTAAAWCWTHAKREFRARAFALPLSLGGKMRLETQWRDAIRQAGILAKARARAEMAKDRARWAAFWQAYENEELA